ncbi:MAG: patatin-like phospholipase family protein [Nitrospirota bacterium]
MQYKYLALQGGGVKGLAYTGALTYLEEIGMLQQMSGFAGTSAGAMTAMLLSVGYTAKEIKNILWDMNLQEFKDDKIGFVRDLFSILYKYGLCPGDKLYHWLKQKLQDKVGSKEEKITFEMLPKDLRVVVTNLTTGKPVILQRGQSNIEDVALAVRVSAGFPVFYQPKIINRNYYVDGGVLQNFPIEVFPPEETLGCILRDYDFEQKQKHEIKNFKTYLAALFETMYNAAQKAYIKPEEYERAIKINIPSYIKTMDMSISIEDKELLYEIGYNSTKNYFIKGDDQK